MSTTDPLIGKKLGDYLIEGVLGTGGMARVYRGYDDKLDRYAAVKVIEPQLIASEEEEEYRERFLREARAIARLNNPNIVGVYQFAQIDNMYFIAMEYIEGRNLREVLKSYIKQEKLIPKTEMLRILKDIATALDYAHKQGIIHRDIKPSNIIVRSDGSAVLTDFGLALNSLEGTIGNTFGSVHYIAPEQAISSAQSNSRSDQYSLGIITYEMVTGRVPFDDASAMSVALKHISDPPPPPTEINPQVLPEVEQAIMQALDKDYQKRFPLSLDFIHALELAYDMQAKSNLRQTGSLANVPVPSGRPSTDDDAPTLTESSLSQALNNASKASAAQMTNQSQNRTLLGVAFILLIALIIAVALLILPSLNGDGGAEATAVAVALATDNAETAVAIAAATTDEPTNTPTDEPTDTPTDEPTNTPTDEPTNTPTDEPTNTPTDEPTDTPTDEPTDTPTDEPTDTPTDEPTNTPTDEPTATATLTATVTPSPAPSPTPGLTIADGDDAQVLLRYDGRTLVLFNRDELNSADIDNLNFYLFEPDPNSDDPENAEIVQSNIFRATEWGNLNSGIIGNACVQVWTINFTVLPIDEEPADSCTSRTYFRSTVRPFWISENPERAYFEVRRGRVDVLAICPVNIPGTFSELRCAVPVD